MSSKAKMFFSSIMDEMRSSKVSRLNQLVKTGTMHRNGKPLPTIDVSSAAIHVLETASGGVEVTVFDRPPGWPHKTGEGVTFYVEPGDTNVARICRDVLFWMSLHCTSFRDKIDPRAVIDAYKHMDEPALKYEFWRKTRQSSAA